MPSGRNRGEIAEPDAPQRLLGPAKGGLSLRFGGIFLGFPPRGRAAGLRLRPRQRKAQQRCPPCGGARQDGFCARKGRSPALSTPLPLRTRLRGAMRPRLAPRRHSEENRQPRFCPLHQVPYYEEFRRYGARRGCDCYGACPQRPQGAGFAPVWRLQAGHERARFFVPSACCANPRKTGKLRCPRPPVPPPARRSSSRAVGRFRNKPQLEEKATARRGEREARAGAFPASQGRLAVAGPALSGTRAHRSGSSATSGGLPRAPAGHGASARLWRLRGEERGSLEAGEAAFHEAH